MEGSRLPLPQISYRHYHVLPRADARHHPAISRVPADLLPLDGLLLCSVPPGELAWGSPLLRPDRRAARSRLPPRDQRYGGALPGVRVCPPEPGDTDPITAHAE